MNEAAPSAVRESWATNSVRGILRKAGRIDSHPARRSTCSEEGAALGKGEGTLVSSK